MTWEAWMALGLVALVLYALARDVAPTDVVLVGAMAVIMTLSLFSDRFPGPKATVAILGNEALLTVAVLFVVAAGLTETGALRMITERALGNPASERDAQVRLALPVIGSSAFLNNTPVVAMFIPVVSDWCKRAGLRPSKLFIPLSYAAVLGGVCTLIGTSTNLVLHGLMIEAQKTDPSMPVMGMFTITPVGVPVAFAGMLFLIATSAKLLPNRQSARSPAAEAREYTVEMQVDAGSPIDGQTIEGAGLRHLPGAYLAAIERQGLRRVPVPPDEMLRGGDQLTFVGVVDSVRDLQRVRGLTPAANESSSLDYPRHVRFLAEAVVSPTSPVVGQSIRGGGFRSRYEAAVIAVHRNGERVEGRIGDIILRAGDTLLLETSRRFMKQHRNSRDFFLVSDVPDSRPVRHDRAWMALAILAGMVAVVAAENVTGVSVFHGALIAALLMGVTRCLSIDQARRSIDWAVLVAIGAALVLGRATEMSGLADTIAGLVVDALHPLGAVAVLAGIYVMTLLFTEIVTNNAAAALAFPIAHGASQELGVGFMPFAIAICIAASAGFATPLGYQTHLMVYGPGGYRFGDFVRVGIPMDIVVMVVALTAIALIFPF